MKRIVDLCAGTGAFSSAFSSENIVFSNDFEDKSKIIYDANFSHKLTLKNLLDIDSEAIPDHDILTCGFPCQPFSISGKKLGFSDTRSGVFWKLTDIIKKKRPECVILENVKNLTTHDRGYTLKIIIDSISELDYDVKYKLINTSKVTGIPQNRERVYFICFRKDLKVSFDGLLDLAPKPKRPLSEFLESNVDEKLYYKKDCNIYKLLEKEILDKNTVYQYRRTYVRKNMSGECPTLTAVMGTGGHNVPIILDNNGIRKLSPRECFNFQGFPSSYILPDLANSHLYKLIGNSVTLDIVKELATRILKILQ
jgi:DNA (cytosine-5)-methyltransferase 1